MFEAVKKTITEIIKPILEEHGVELVDLSIKRRGRVFSIEVLADRDEGGITLDECAHINKYIAFHIEQEGLIEDDYVVEVSSPGIDRPLKTERDFRRVVGRSVRVHLKEPVENKLEHHGIVDSVEEGGINLDIKLKMLMIPFENIQKAIQII